MAIRVIRLGTARTPDEGVRLGTVRRPPRGVKKEEFAKRDYYDVWLPELSPSGDLVAFAMGEEFTQKRWLEFERKYRREMAEAAPQHLLQLLAALSSQTNFSIGCYCEDETMCHRSVLRQLLIEHGALVTE